MFTHSQLKVLWKGKGSCIIDYEQVLVAGVNIYTLFIKKHLKNMFWQRSSSYSALYNVRHGCFFISSSFFNFWHFLAGSHWTKRKNLLKKISFLQKQRAVSDSFITHPCKNLSQMRLGLKNVEILSYYLSVHGRLFVLGQIQKPQGADNIRHTNPNAHRNHSEFIVTHPR